MEIEKYLKARDIVRNIDREQERLSSMKRMIRLVGSGAIVTSSTGSDISFVIEDGLLKDVLSLCIERSEARYMEFQKQFSEL